MTKVLDRTGQRFGRLVVTAQDTPAGRSRRWKCLCDCGKSKTVYASNLVSGGTRSCGCLLSETARERATVDQRSRHPLHNTWHQMRARCTRLSNRQYQDYGARGIKVCERWQDFAAFVDDVGERPSPAHSLDRIDNDGNYEPGNVRWATAKEQANNQRKRTRNSDLGYRQTGWAYLLGI